MKTFKCPLCDKKYDSKERLYNHIDSIHPESIKDGYTPARVYFNYVNKKEHGKCVICGKETAWNETTRKYYRFCGEKCKEKYVKEMKNRMLNTYGKVHLLNDPKKQREMLANRSISGVYKFKDGGEHGYTGSYEHDFLEFLDKGMGFNSLDVISPCPFTFYYTYEGKQLFYIPDVYIPSLNLIVEIKDGGDNPNTHPKIQEVDKAKEHLKDELMAKGTYNYLKLTNKDHFKFVEFLINLKDKDDTDKKPIISIGESFKYIGYIMMENLSQYPVNSVYLESPISETVYIKDDSGNVHKVLMDDIYKDAPNAKIAIYENTLNVDMDAKELISEACSIMSNNPVLVRGTKSLLDENIMRIEEMTENMKDNVYNIIEGLTKEEIISHDGPGMYCKDDSENYYYRTESLMTNKARSIQEIPHIQVLLIKSINK